jgi:hypothetical protein
MNSSQSYCPLDNKIYPIDDENKKIFAPGFVGFSGNVNSSICSKKYENSLIIENKSTNNTNDNYKNNTIFTNLSLNENTIKNNNNNSTNDHIIFPSVNKNEKTVIFKISKEQKKKSSDRKANKIKRFKYQFFHHFLIIIANKIIEKFGEKKIFIKANKNLMENLDIKPNIALFNSTIETFFCFEKSTKYSRKYKNFHNKTLLNKYKNDNEFKKFINMKIIDLYNIFKADNCKQILKKEFNIECEKSMNSILKNLENKLKKDYVEGLKKIWNNIYKFFNENNKNIKYEDDNIEHVWKINEPPYKNNLKK